MAEKEAIENWVALYLCKHSANEPIRPHAPNSEALTTTRNIAAAESGIS